MTNGINDSLSHRCLWKFETGSCRSAVRRIVMSYLIADMRHDEKGSVIDQLEDVA
jgi:hypothetical protein